MGDNYQVDMNAAKNTKLFKKFMRNKTIGTESPKGPSRIEQNSIIPVKFEEHPILYKQYIREASYPRQTNQESPRKVTSPLHNNRVKILHEENDVRSERPTFNIPKSHYNQSFQAQHQPFDHQQQPLEHNFARNTTNDENDFRRKYDKLYEKYEELKKMTSKENKIRKKEVNEWQEEIELIKQKLFEVQTRQDSLIIENKRLKDRLQAQNLTRIKLEEDNKEFNYKFQELEDMLSGKDGNIKKKADEAQYWKSHYEKYKEENSALRLTFEKLKDRTDFLEGEFSIAKKEKDNGESLNSELRKQIQALLQENSAAKDQIYNIATKVYHLEQENQVLKSDVKRQKQGSIKYMQSTSQNELMRGVINENQSEILNIKRQQFQPPSFQGRRRGEFSKARVTSAVQKPPEKPDFDQRIPTNPNHHSHNSAVNKIAVDKSRRIKEINDELDKIAGIKVMPGSLRRKKIELERELADLDESELR